MDKRQQQVFDMFSSGMAPSEVDAAMRLPSGTTRGVVVDVWYADKHEREG